MCVLSASCQKNFEGKIVYKNSYESKHPNLNSEQLNKMMGTKQDYYIKNNMYKSIFNGVFTKMQVYRGDENRNYTLTAKNDTLYWEDYSTSKETIIKLELLKKTETVFGAECEILYLETNKGKTYFFFNRKYGINPSLFSSHNYGNWNKIISITNSLPLKTIYETNEYKFTSTAIEIVEERVSDALFEITDKKKVARATW